MHSIESKDRGIAFGVDFWEALHGGAVYFEEGGGQEGCVEESGGVCVPC